MPRSVGLPEIAVHNKTDPRYAWVMLPLAMLMHVGTCPGQTFGISLFNEPIRESLGLSHTMLTGAYLVASLLAAVPLMAIGRRMDRHGLRWVSLAMVSMVGLGCVTIANVQSVVGLTIAFFVLRAFGQGGLSLAAGNTLGMWFVRRLGLASGVAGLGMSVAIAVTPLAYHRLIEALGWRNAYAVIGLFTWAILLPVLALLYRNNSQVDDTTPNPENNTSKQTADNPPLPLNEFDLQAAMQTPAYWVAATCTALAGMICTGIFFNLVPLFEQHSMTATQAAAIFPVVAIAMATMQINGGLLADRLPLPWLLSAAMACLAIGVVVLGHIESMLAAYVTGALLGAGQGLLSVTGNTLWPRYFGRQHLGTVRSSVWTVSVAACAAGPFLMGVTLDLTGSYASALWLFVGLASAASIAAAGWATPPVETTTAELAISSGS